MNRAACGSRGGHCARAFLGAVGDETASESAFFVNLPFDYCSKCRSLRRHGARPCKHIIFCRGLHVNEQLTRGVEPSVVRQPWWARDTAAYLKDFLVTPSTRSAAPAVPAVVDGSRMISAAGVATLSHNFESLLLIK